MMIEDMEGGEGAGTGATAVIDKPVKSDGAATPAMDSPKAESARAKYGPAMRLESSPVDVKREVQEAKQLGKSIIEDKIADIKEDYTDASGMVDTKRMKTDGVFNIYAVYVFSEKGFTPTEYGKYEKDGGIPLNGDRGFQVTDADGNAVTAIAIQGQRIENGQLVYDCITDFDHPDQTVQVNGDEIAQAHMQDKEDSIMDAFAYPGQKDLVKYYINDEQDIPDSIKEAVKKEKDPLVQADRLIAQRIDELKATRDSLDSKLQPGRDAIINQLEFSLKCNGELGALAKLAALDKLVSTVLKDAKLDTVIAALKPEADKAEQKLEESGLSKKEIKKMKESNFESLIEDKDLIKKVMGDEKLAEKVFGDNPPSQSDMEAAADKHFSKDEKEKLKTEFGDSWWKIMLLILAGIIVLPVVGTVAAATSAASAMSKQ